MPLQATLPRAAPAWPQAQAEPHADAATPGAPGTLPGARAVAPEAGPRSFAERGVAVPFTTPLLWQARLRADRAGQLEVLLPNPAGMRGMYVVSWQGLRGLARLTVHDMRLLELLGATSEPASHQPTPARVRQAARSAACEGLAGRPARHAALAAREAERRRNAAAAFALLVRAHSMTTGEVITPEDAVREGQGFMARARAAIATLARRTGVTLEQWLHMTEALAPLVAGIGVPETYPATAAALAPEVAVLAEALRRGPEELRTAAVLAEAAAACATQARIEARRAIADLPSVALAWVADPETLTGLLERPDWILDGWDHLVATWHQAVTPEAQAVAGASIARLAPALPAQAQAWTGLPVPPPPPGRPAPPAQDWREAAQVTDTQARLESLRDLVP
jgi:hypothetical protein